MTMTHPSHVISSDREVACEIYCRCNEREISGLFTLSSLSSTQVTTFIFLLLCFIQRKYAVTLIGLYGLSTLIKEKDKTQI